MDKDASTRIAALEALVRELAARLEEIHPAAERSAIESRISALETRNAVLELRLAENEDAVGDMADEAGGDGAAFETGGPTEPYTPGAHDEIEPDSKILKGGTGPHPIGNSRKDKSLQWASGATSVMQLHRFDQASSLVHEIPGPYDETSGSGSGDDPIQFAGRVPEGGDIKKGGELKWFELKTTAKTRLDTDETGTITTPGQSIDRVTVSQSGGPSKEDLQLRKFADTADTQNIIAANSTSSGYKPEDVHILMRRAKSNERPKLVYVLASTGPFWIKGGTYDQNYAVSIKIGDVTLSTI